MKYCSSIKTRMLIKHFLNTNILIISPSIFVRAKYICCSFALVLSALIHINSKLLIKCVGGNCSHECGKKKADNGDNLNHGGGIFTSAFCPGYISLFISLLSEPGPFKSHKRLICDDVRSIFKWQLRGNKMYTCI